MTNSQAGYTLLETLVAFAIMASVLIVLYAAGGGALRLIGTDTQMRQAVLLAQSKLDEIQMRRDPLVALSTGTFDGSNVDWRIDARDLDASQAGITPYRLQAVTLTLHWPHANKIQSLILQTRHLGILKP